MSNPNPDVIAAIAAPILVELMRSASGAESGPDGIPALRSKAVKHARALHDEAILFEGRQFIDHLSERDQSP